MFTAVYIYGNTDSKGYRWVDSPDLFIESVTIYSVGEGSYCDVIGYCNVIERLIGTQMNRSINKWIKNK